MHERIVLIDLHNLLIPGESNRFKTACLCECRVDGIHHLAQCNLPGWRSKSQAQPRGCGDDPGDTGLAAQGEIKDLVTSQAVTIEK